MESIPKMESEMRSVSLSLKLIKIRIQVQAPLWQNYMMQLVTLNLRITKQESSIYSKSLHGKKRMASIIMECNLHILAQVLLEAKVINTKILTADLIPITQSHKLLFMSLLA